MTQNRKEIRIAKMAELKRVNTQKNEEAKALKLVKKLEADKAKAVSLKLKSEAKDKKIADSILKKQKPPFASKNDPQQSIKAENFNDRVTSIKTGENGFYVTNDSNEFDEYDYDNNSFSDGSDVSPNETNDSSSGDREQNQSMSGNPETMGFDLFGITVNTDSLLNKATTAAQTAITNYLAPAPPATAIPVVAANAAASAANSSTNIVNMPLDPMVKQAMIIGGGMVGLLLAVTIIKTAFK